MTRHGTGLILAIIGGVWSPLTAAWAGESEIAEGRRLFIEHCDTCHGVITTDPDYVIARLSSARLHLAMAPPYGPNLTGVIDREAGTVPDYDYSTEFERYVGDVIWEPETLDAWITDTQAVAPGTRMYFRQKDEAVRQRIIDYLVAYD